MKLFVISLLGIGLFVTPSIAQNIEGPFGTSFGQKLDKKKYQVTSRNRNLLITKLLTRERPPATQELAAQFCDNFGLQKVIWVSRGKNAYKAMQGQSEILKGLTKKYGVPKTKPVNEAALTFWKTSSGIGIGAYVQSRPGNVYQNIVEYDGPHYERCLANHEKASKSGF